ncbi:MAG: Hpt domain-containing protein, partial [Nitrospira sp.]|nr:Hpt domain-containing protein [Nitrospira sp.]
LLRLADNPNDLETLNDIFRPVHNIKGGSQITGLDKVSRLSHRLEDLLDILRQGNMQSDIETVDLLIETRDRILRLVSELEEHQEEQSDIEDLVDRLTVLIEAEKGAPAEMASPVAESMPEASGYQEEHDQELFGIFMNHLREQVHTLRQAVANPASEPDLEHHLQWCEGIIDSLLSAANYMGYQDLVDLYVEWRGLLSDCRQDLVRGDTPDMDFMQEYLSRVESLFPDLDSWQDAPHEPNTAKSGKPARPPAESALDIADEDALMPALDDVTGDVMSVFSGMVPDSDLELDADEADTDDGLSAHVEEVLEDSFDADDIDESLADASPPEPRVSLTPEPEMQINMALLQDFIVEAGEHLDEIEVILLQLSDDPQNMELLNDVFRPVHNIKGGSQITGLAKISRLAHRLEDLLDMLRLGQIQSNMGIIDLLIDARDRIVQLVNELSLHQQELSAIDELVMKLSHRIDGSTGMAAETATMESESEVGAAALDGDTVAGMASANSTMSNGQSTAVYDEEHDQELFGIFMHHLQEQVSILRKAINELNEEPDKVHHLQWCSDTIGRLWSAANYMGYHDLTALYENWRAFTDQACAVWTNGGKAPLEFMSDFLEQLDAIFPQLRNVPTTAIKGDLIEPAAAQAAPATKPAAGKTAGASAKPASTPKGEAQLYDQLSGALDSTIVQGVSDQQQDALNQIYDEMITGAQAKAKAKPQAANGNARARPGAAGDGAAGAGAKSPAEERRRPMDTMEKKIKKSMRVDAEKIDSLMNLVGELVVDRSYFFQLSNEMRNMQNYLKDIAGVDQKEVKLLRAFTYRLGEAIASLGRTSNELQEGVMKMRMLPISQIFNRYPRLVRDLTHTSDKKVELVIQGEDTELDKMIVEELSDPLIHIIRNAVDHGLETREERRKAGKSEAGTLTLNAYQESNNIVIEVTDDGRGISPERIKVKALDKGLYTAEELERMNPRDLTQLILMPGFSTAEKVTGTSGRGVGMDVVKRNIEKLNGILEIDSKPGVRTQMRLKIPLTLAIIHALMIRVGLDLFTIPLANVDETVRIFRHETSKVEGVEVIHLRGHALPIFHLSKLFNIKADENTDKVFVVIVNTEGARTGFVVDELIGQEEVVIKPLADYVQEKSGFSGATIVGDGRISLILDAHELVKMTSGRQAKMHRDQATKLRTRIRRGPK